MQQRVLDLLIEHCIGRPWQAIVTTHSDHLLRAWNREGVRCVEVAREGQVSTARAPAGRDALLNVIERLGASGASVLAARTVVWVEGPSDAIYLRFFLKEYLRALGESETLTEFVDYAFAFFGGSLLTHTRLAEAPDREFVDLFSLHTGSYVVLDSDRPSKGAPLGKPYARVFEDAALPGRVWITQGREMENYLPDHILAWAAHGDVSQPILATVDRDYAIFRDQVQNVKAASGRQRAKADASDNEKPRFAAKAVAEMECHLSRDALARLDLRERLEGLVTFIRRAP